MRSSAIGRWEAAWPVGGILVVVVGTFASAFFSPLVFFERDILGYWYPGIDVFRRAVQEGTWPLWNPYFGFGAPLLADASIQIAYPPTWLTLLISNEAYYKLFVALHCGLAGTGTFLLARRLGCGRLPSFLAGGAFAICGPLVSAVNLFHHFAGAAWLPFTLWAMEGLLQRSARAGPALGVLGACQVLAGSGDLCLMSAMGMAIRVAFHLKEYEGARGAELKRLLRAGGMAAVLGLSIAAVQWLPTLEVARGSTRRAQPESTSTYWSVHPASLLDLAAPRLLADLPMAPWLRAAVFESRGPFLRCLYLGPPLLLLALLGLAVPGRHRGWLAVAAAFFLLCALGRFTPFYHFLLSLPGLGVLRYPVKYLWPFSLFIALLAARGLDRWGKEWDEHDQRRAFAIALLAVTLAAVAGVGALAARRAPALFSRWLEAGASEPERLARAVSALGQTTGVAFAAAGLLALRARAGRPAAWLSATAVALVVADLMSVSAGVNRLAPPELVKHRPRFADRLTAEPSARIYVASWPAECYDVVRAPSDWPREWTGALGEVESLSAPSGARWGIRGSYDGEFIGLGPAAQGGLTAELRGREGTAEGLRLLRLGAVTHVVAARGSRDRLGLPVLDEMASVYSCPLQLLTVDKPLPTSYLVTDALAPPSGVAGFVNSGFDPARAVVLEEAASPPGAAASLAGSVTVRRRRMDSLDLEVDANAPSILVVTDAFAPGWRGFVDGQPAAVLRANLLFRGMRVPAGRHRVELVYRPRAVLVGAGLSLAGLLGIGVAFLGSRASGLPPWRTQDTIRYRENR